MSVLCDAEALCFLGGNKCYYLSTEIFSAVFFRIVAWLLLTSVITHEIIIALPKDVSFPVLRCVYVEARLDN
jgi:hypothetical protein